MTLVQQQAFCRQIHLLLKTGISLIDTCRLSELHELETELSNGVSPSKIMAKLNFDPFCVSLIAVGETAGQLEQSFDQVAQHLDMKIRIQKKIKKALTYPAIVLVMAIIMTTGIFQWVIPHFADIFKSLNAELPWLTVKMIAISENWIWVSSMIFGIPVLVILSLYLAWQSSMTIQRLLDYLTIHLPIYGPIKRLSISSTWSKQLSQLCQTQVPILDALKSISLSSPNWITHDLSANLHRELNLGQSFDQALAKCLAARQLFSVQDMHLLKISQQNGQLPETLATIGNCHENNLEHLTENLGDLIEPVLIMVMGILVGTIVISLYLPIFEMGQGI